MTTRRCATRPGVVKRRQCNFQRPKLHRKRVLCQNPKSPLHRWTKSPCPAGPRASNGPSTRTPHAGYVSITDDESLPFPAYYYPRPPSAFLPCCDYTVYVQSCIVRPVMPNPANAKTLSSHPNFLFFCLSLLFPHTVETLCRTNNYLIN